MTLYHAKFRQNGRCGYVLKPQFMRSSNDVIVEERQKDVVIKVICGSSIACQFWLNVTIIVIITIGPTLLQKPQMLSMTGLKLKLGVLLWTMVMAKELKSYQVTATTVFLLHTILGF